MMTLFRPVFWLLSSPSISVLFAMRGWPLISVLRLSCELKNCECGRNGRVAPGTVTSRPWKLRLKPRGISVTTFDSSSRPVSVRSVWRMRRLGGDRHRLVHLSELERQVDAHRRVDVDADVLPDDLAEAGQLGLDRVGAVPQAREDVVAGFVGDSRAADVGLGFDGRDRRPGNRAAARIRDVTEQRAALRPVPEPPLASPASP